MNRSSGFLFARILLSLSLAAVVRYTQVVALHILETLLKPIDQLSGTGVGPPIGAPVGSSAKRYCRCYYGLEQLNDNVEYGMSEDLNLHLRESNYGESSITPKFWVQISLRDLFAVLPTCTEPQLMSTIKAGAVMKALVGSESGGYRLAEDINIPVSKPGTMLCQVHAVALSPYDAKIVDYSNTPGAVGGCDFAGIVVRVGEGVTRFKEGHWVLAVTFGLNASDKTAGAFAEYALATEDLCCHVPDNLSFAQASSMGLGIATAELALFPEPGQHLKLPRHESADENTPSFVLVSGGATGTGTMAIQFLKIAGYTPIVTCSPANNALCEAYGAVACFDYHSSTCGADIREYTANSLVSVFDCVTDASAMRMCYEAIGSSGGKYVALEAITPVVKYTRRDVRADWLMTSTIMGTPVEIPGTYGRPSTLEHRIFGMEFFLLAETLLKEGKIKNHPLEIREGGLASIPTCVNDLRVGNVRAKRQVVLLVGA